MNETVRRLMFGSRKTDETIGDENTHILVVTTSLQRDFEVIDSICRISSATAGFDGIRLEEAFRLVKNKLRAAAIDMGGDAVIECQFAHRGVHDGGRQAIELWAFGTVVKFN